MSSSSDSDASSSASEGDDDSLSPADLAAINAFVGETLKLEAALKGKL